ncbi:dioxygenase [Bacteroides sedimenti]|uniref:Dioxygenase n=2 Tax=Bacteroides sedimenti TaxID=2136147 RepID=A0ABN6Z382_9BACE
MDNNKLSLNLNITRMKDLFNILDRVIVVTGGYGVLGKGISIYLAQQGAKVVILGRDQEAGNKLVGEIKNKGGQAMFTQGDVTDKEMLEKCKKQIMDKYGKIDVLINAAGGNMPGATISPDKTIFDLDTDAMKKVVDLNLFGTVLPTIVFASEMAKQNNGVILNFSSESSLRPLTRVAGYGVAKAAINNFTQYMAGELAIKFGNGIRMNAVAPGFFLTTQNEALLINQDGSFSDRAKTILAHTPFNRFGVPEDLYGTIHYLISDASKFVTGTVAVVDGGFNAFSI